MSVGGTDYARAKHYGTAYAMTDYTSKAQNLYISAAYMPTSKLKLHGMIDLNISEAFSDPAIMPDSAALVDDHGVPAGFLLSHDYDFSEIFTYSDFDYEILRFSLGLSYKLADDVTFTADGQFADLTDNQGYVYGNESGSFIMVRTGIQFKF